MWKIFKFIHHLSWTHQSVSHKVCKAPAYSRTIISSFVNLIKDWAKFHPAVECMCIVIGQSSNWSLDYLYILEEISESSTHRAMKMIQLPTWCQCPWLLNIFKRHKTLGLRAKIRTYNQFNSLCVDLCKTLPCCHLWGHIIISIIFWWLLWTGWTLCYTNYPNISFSLLNKLVLGNYN